MRGNAANRRTDTTFKTVEDIARPEDGSTTNIYRTADKDVLSAVRNICYIIRWKDGEVSPRGRD